MLTLELHALGARLFAAIDNDSAEAERALEGLPSHFDALELRASRFRKGSELTRLNDAPGQTVEVSEALWADIAAAIDAARWSGGLVTPTVLEALESAGYDQSFEQLLASPHGDAASGRPVLDVGTIELDPSRRGVCVPPGARLDLGGTAKGRAADLVARLLGRHGPALVDAGGDVAVSGPRADGSAWPIGVADPREPEQALEIIALEAGGVATSGRDHRRWASAHGPAHHIIDPRTGRPAVTDVLSASVIASSAFRAEVAAKTLLLLGSSAGIDWIEAHDGLAALVVLEDGSVVESRGLARYHWRET